MKAASASLIALLNAQTFNMADLFTFTLANGTVLRYTNSDGDLTVAGNLFSSVNDTGTARPGLTRGKTRTIIGVEVDTLDVSFGANSGVQISGIPVMQFAQQGGFDGATLQLERAFMPIGQFGTTTAGTLIMFVGRVAEVIASRTQVDMKVNSSLELLNVQIPRNLYQAGCVHTLFDAGCTLARASYANATTAAAGSTAKVLNCGLSNTTGYYDLGTVSFTSGANNGLTRTIKSQTLVAGADVITLAYPLPVAPTIGDGFTAYPGCDKQQTTCNSKFSNLANFKGAPYIPSPETSY